MSKAATAKKSAISKAQFQTIEAIRRCTADVLSRFQDTPLTRYEAGFQAGFEELGRLLHPAGYDRERSRSELIAGLLKPLTKTSTATRTGDLEPTCQPVQIAELAKSEIYNDRN
jgi:hypothetical protein